MAFICLLTCRRQVTVKLFKMSYSTVRGCTYGAFECCFLCVFVCEGEGTVLLCLANSDICSENPGVYNLVYDPTTDATLGNGIATRSLPPKPITTSHKVPSDICTIPESQRHVWQTFTHCRC